MNKNNYTAAQIINHVSPKSRF